MCVYVYGFSFNFFFQKVHNLSCFKINVFLHCGKEQLGGNKEEAFVQEQGQYKAEFLYLQGVLYPNTLCVIFLA